MKDIYEVLQAVGNRELTLQEIHELKQKLIASGVARWIVKDLFAGAMYGMGAAKLEKMLKERFWLKQIEALRPGDACETRIGDRWVLGSVIHNGGASWWQIFLEHSKGRGTYTCHIEHVRLPGQVEAWPR